MKTKAPSSMKRFAAARQMPVAPPVITAVFPFSLFMTYPSRLAPLVVRDDPENLNLGPPQSGGQCGMAHISGAKTIQFQDSKPRQSGALRLGVLGCVSEGAAAGAGMHHDRLG